MSEIVFVGLNYAGSPGPFDGRIVEGERLAAWSERHGAVTFPVDRSADHRSGVASAHWRRYCGRLMDEIGVHGRLTLFATPKHRRLSYVVDVELPASQATMSPTSWLIPICLNMGSNQGRLQLAPTDRPKFEPLCRPDGQIRERCYRLIGATSVQVDRDGYYEIAFHGHMPTSVIAFAGAALST